MDSKRWNVRRSMKMHIAVNKKTKEILSMKVTKEYVHDGKNLIPLVKGAGSVNLRV